MNQHLRVSLRKVFYREQGHVDLTCRINFKRLCKEAKPPIGKPRDFWEKDYPYDPHNKKSANCLNIQLGIKNTLYAATLVGKYCKKNSRVYIRIELPYKQSVVNDLQDVGQLLIFYATKKERTKEKLKHFIAKQSAKSCYPIVKCGSIGKVTQSLLPSLDSAPNNN